LQYYVEKSGTQSPVVNGFWPLVKKINPAFIFCLARVRFKEILLNLGVQSSLIKIALRIGLITSAAIVVYELSNLLLIYHYFNYQFYLGGVAIIALLTGIALTNRYHKNKRSLMSATASPVESLTAKELKILELISEGKSNKEIAAINFVEVSTVKTHTNNIYTKLCVKNRKDAARAYEQFNISSKSTLSPPITT
jgi:DNA-binding CsgD family transcriptional regulator